MATGDAAAAAGMAVVNGATTDAKTIDTEINLTRDYIAQGKGATSAATANKVVIRDAAGRAKFATPAATGDAATKGYVDGQIAGIQAQLDAATASGDIATSAGKLVRWSVGTHTVGVPTPSSGTHAANKAYVDTHTTEVVQQLRDLIDTLTARVAALEQPPEE